MAPMTALSNVGPKEIKLRCKSNSIQTLLPKRFACIALKLDVERRTGRVVQV
jgi:hypothetical protein